MRTYRNDNRLDVYPFATGERLPFRLGLITGMGINISGEVPESAPVPEVVAVNVTADGVNLMLGHNEHIIGVLKGTGAPSTVQDIGSYQGYDYAGWVTSNVYDDDEPTSYNCKLALDPKCMVAVKKVLPWQVASNYKKATPTASVVINFTGLLGATVVKRAGGADVTVTTPLAVDNLWISYPDLVKNNRYTINNQIVSGINSVSALGVGADQGVTLTVVAKTPEGYIDYNGEYIKFSLSGDVVTEDGYSEGNTAPKVVDLTICGTHKIKSCFTEEADQADLDISAYY